MFKKKTSTKSLIQPSPPVTDLFKPDRVTEREDYVVINNLYCRYLVVDMLPEEVVFGILTQVTTIPGVTVNTTIYPYSRKEASDRIAKQSGGLGADLILAEKQGNNRRRDVLEEKYFLYRSLLKDVNLNRTTINAAVIVISVTAPSLEELNKKCSDVQDGLGGIKATSLYLNQIEGYKAMLPNMNNNIKAYHDVTIENAACLLPLIGVNVSHPRGIYFGKNQKTLSPCLVDLFIGRPYLFGPHMFITGMTRSGKSYMLKGTLARSIASGRKAMVIDPEGEYRGLAAAVNGLHFRFTPSMKQRFNPFDIEPSYDEQTDTYYLDIAEKMDDISSLVKTVLETQFGQRISVEEAALLGRAIRFEYNSRGIFEDDPNSIYETGGVDTPEGFRSGTYVKEMPTFSSLSETIINESAGSRLYDVLSNFREGGVYSYFDGQTSVNLKDYPLVVFDITELKNEDSKMVAMYVLLAWMTNNFVRKDRHIQKHVVADEAWLMMKNAYTAMFLSNIARRGAKYNCSIITASQSFREFTSKEGQVFMNQCDTKFFMRMQESDANGLAEIFNLSPEMLVRIQSFPSGTGILYLGKESGVVQFHGLPFEERFLSSDPNAQLLR